MKSLNGIFSVVSILAILGFERRAFSQTPTLLWTTNVAGTVLATDSETNVYAQAGGNVIKLSGDGIPLQTIVLSTNTGLAQRDAAGNFYYAGVYPGSPSGSHTCYGTNHSFFLAKYDSSGVQQWSVDFGLTAGCVQSIVITDFKFDLNENLYVGYEYGGTGNYLDFATKFDANGAILWSTNVPQGLNSSPVGVRFGPLWSTTGTAFTFNDPYMASSVLDLLTGSAIWKVSLSGPIAGFGWMRPVGNFDQQFYETEAGSLVKRDKVGNVLWSRGVPSGTWTVGEDFYGGAHVANDNGNLSRYDYDGNLVWTINLASPCKAMVLDSFGNRFISMVNGSVARLSDEVISGPGIVAGPQSQTILVGSNYNFTVSATGSAPLRYEWSFNGGAVPSQSSSSLALTNVTIAQAGSYRVTVSNFVGAVTSAPALLRVKSVALFLGNQLLTNGTYTFVSPPTLSIRSAYTNGSSFYTLDGTAPSFSSTYYSGPFTVPHSATVRAIGYTSDFLQSEEADPINVVVLTTHTLNASSPGGGSVTLNPPGGTYVSTNVVTVSAVPDSGWTFLYWLGDATNNSATIQVSMERDKALQAIFSTTLSTTVAGNGQVQLYPVGGTYAYGTEVRLTGVPGPGSYFGFWGNAASGNANPLYFTVTTANQTISSIFGTTQTNQSSLTVLINGNGRVSRNPSANVYQNTDTVILTATPDAGQSFVNWSNDASGSQNPLSLSMSQSRVVTANFAGRPLLRADRPGIEGLSPDGFRFTLVTSPSNRWEIYGSSNLVSWDLLGAVTNVQGEAQFLDSNAVSFSSHFYRARLAP